MFTELPFWYTGIAIYSVSESLFYKKNKKYFSYLDSDRKEQHILQNIENQKVHFYSPFNNQHSITASP